MTQVFNVPEVPGTQQQGVFPNPPTMAKDARSSITRSFDELSDRIMEIDSLSQHLFDRFGSVLGAIPEVGSKESLRADSFGNSQLCSIIDGFSSQLLNISSRIKQLNGACEL